MPTFARRVYCVLFVMGSALLAMPSVAAVTTFVDNLAGFNAAAAAASRTSICTEDFESSTVPPNTLPPAFGPKIEPGVATTNFPTGTLVACGITVQSNTLGNSPTTVSPGVFGSLATASAGYAGTPDDQVSSNLPNESFDIIFNPPSGIVKAVRLTPLYFDFNGVVFTNTMVIRVYNKANVLIATSNFTGGNYQTEASKFGVVATGDDNIGRINIFGGAPATSAYGADDIEVFIAPPTITSATYDAFNGILSVTAVDMSAGDIIDVSKLSVRGQGGNSYTLTTSNVTASSSTAFSVTLNAADRLNVNGLLNQTGLTAVSGTTFNLEAAASWDAAVPTAADLTGNAITVSNVIPPTITSATFDGTTNVFTVTGTNLVKTVGSTNDITIIALTVTGEGGATRIISNTSNVEITSDTSFTFTLAGADIAPVNALLNKNGTSAASGTGYNLAAADDWNSVITGGNIADLTGNGITVSNAKPIIQNATYDAASGILAVSMLNSVLGDNIDVSKLSITGQAGNYTLTTANVFAVSSNAFIVTLNAADKLAVNGVLNNNGTSAVDTTTYNLAAAANWNLSRMSFADLTGNDITVSNVTAPTITSATYNAGTNVFVVTGSNLVKTLGTTNDITINKLTITGQGGATRTLSTTANVEITSATSFSFTLAGADIAAVNALLNNNGTSAFDATTYNLAAADDWNSVITGGNIQDLTGNGITVSGLTSCTVGSYSVTGNSPCTQASAGFYVNTGGAMSQTACLAGTYSATLGATSIATCIAASLGNFVAAAGSAAQTQCLAGSFAASTGLSACTLATAGSFVAAVGASAQIACAAGTFSATAGAAACTPAPTGSFVATTGATGATLCAVGTYSSTTGNAACTPASLGNFVGTTGATAQTQCSAGSFAASPGLSACTPASAGSFVAAAGASAQASCGTGSFSATTGAASCTPAPAGSFVALTGATSASLCPAGSFSSTAGAASCTLAPAGSYVATTGATAVTLCAAGSSSATVGATSAATCILAPAGSFVATTGAAASTLCAIGSFSTTAGSTSCTPAPAGSFVATTGATAATLCAIGTYSSTTGNAACTPASLGNFVSITGATAQSQCLAGSFAAATGLASCNLAAAGSFVAAAGASAQVACAAGSFSATTGSTSCTQASAGSFAAGTGNTAQTACAAGSFSSTVGAASCTLAPAGSYVAATGSTSATLCAAGSSSATVGATSAATCLPAPAGSFVATAGATAATLCAVGSFSNTSGSTSCTQAPAGSFVSTSGSTSASLCAIGTYSASAGNASCTPASVGNFVSITGATAQSQCLAGSFAAATGLASCSLAAAGSFVAAAGASAQVACAAGSFSTATGATSCTQASAGSFAAGTGNTAQTACAAGSFSNAAGAAICTLAAAGSYVAATGSTSATLCAAGTSSATVGATSAATCLPAPAGSFVAGAGATAATLCAVGTFTSTTGNASCTPAPAGSFVGTLGATGATLCALGSFTSTTGNSACTQATAGNYVAITGASTQTQCAAGTFSNVIGATSAAVCTLAPAGSYAVAGATAATLCAAGTYSATAGAASCTAASIGFYVPLAGATAQIVCPANTFTPSAGAVACSLNPPPMVTVSINGALAGASSVAGGTASPIGTTQIGYGGSLDVMITANPRYIAAVGGSCAGRIITPQAAFVPPGAGSSTYRTDATTNDCTIIVSFIAVKPTLTISGSSVATAVNTTPTQTYSVVGAPATFTAQLNGAIGVLNLYNTAPTPVFISFQADGIAIPSCAQQPISRTVVADESITRASCTVSNLSLGSKVITASFSGDNYNFPATTDAAATPTQALKHIIIAVGALPPVVVPPVVVPPVVVVPPTTPTTLPNVPSNLPPITLTLRPMANPAATPQAPSNPAAANGSVSPNGVGGTNGAGGILEVAANSTVDLTITANPRYLAQVSGSCGGRIITSTSLVPQGAGSNTYRTAAVGAECTVVVTFIPALPTITVSGSNRITPVNTTPIQSTSVLDQSASFTATLRQAIGIVGLNQGTPSQVFISFYADDAPIIGCEQQAVTLAFGLDDSYYQATCSTRALPLGTSKITVSFSGDKYNFPAITDSNKTPTPVLTHIVRSAP